jgi:hypothetical protein
VTEICDTFDGLPAHPTSRHSRKQLWMWRTLASPLTAIHFHVVLTKLPPLAHLHCRTSERHSLKVNTSCPSLHHDAMADKPVPNLSCFVPARRPLDGLFSCTAGANWSPILPASCPFDGSFSCTTGASQCLDDSRL